jgi:DNA-binding SARP family transcriptional activator
MSTGTETRTTIDAGVACDLIAAGRYDEVLAAVSAAGPAREDEASPQRAALVAAAAQLCASGARCRAEADFHAGARAAAVERENELRRHLRDLLGLLAGAAPAGSPARPEPTGEGADLIAFCLGGFRLYQAGAPVTGWRGAKCQSVLRYLLLHRRRVPKEVLMDLFWPDSDTDAARRNLHQAVYSVRQVLRRRDGARGHLRFADDCYFLDPELQVWLDVEELERRAERAERLEREGRVAAAMTELAAAERLYAGDLFEDRPYDEWAIAERERLRGLRRRVVTRLGEHHLERGEHDATIALCQKLLAEDACDEDSHRRLIACYLAQGRRGLAAQQYRACRDALRAELDVEPSAETAALGERCRLSAA